MSLPPFAAFPAGHFQKELLPEEWEACLDSWILLIQAHLLLPQKSYALKLNKDPSVTDFLLSFLRQNSHAEDLPVVDLQQIKILKSHVFLLVHRALTDGDPAPAPLLEASFFEDLSIAYGRNASLRELLYGQYLMEGSDFLDSLSICYKHKAPDFQKKIVITAYLCLTSLLETDSPKISTLIDHLYSLKSTSGPDYLLQSICSSTPFLQKLRAKISGPEAARARSLLQQLSAFETTASGKPRRLIKRKVNKGKSRARQESGHGAFDNAHAHSLSLITQIQDLFPDLGSGFIVKLLSEYNDDTEQVIAHLLDESLPAHLTQADRTENISIPTDEQSLELVPDLVPRSTPTLGPQIKDPAAKSRRSVFDDDAFSKLAISPSQIHYGRSTNTTQTADDLLSTPYSTSNKAAILSALAAFDSDDDERDDTYDVEDVGGTVDSAQPGTSDDVLDAEGLKQNQHEETLFQAWKMSPGLFGRDPTTRRSQARAALRSEIGMTDEAIEGWAIMLQRDPRNLKRLEAKSDMAGRQKRKETPMWTVEVLREVEEAAEPGAEVQEEAEVEVGEEAASPGQQTIKGHRWQGRGKTLTRDQERITIEGISEPGRWLEEDSLDDVP
ncbi:hypothetical protein G7Y79_00003g009260 [Physcia stellaris]|nr:hypothetical protein G7Y79_00003g009260 [Physcia stellaris]